MSLCIFMSLLFAVKLRPATMSLSFPKLIFLLSCVILISAIMPFINSNSQLSTPPKLSEWGGTIQPVFPLEWGTHSYLWQCSGPQNRWNLCPVRVQQ